MAQNNGSNRFTDAGEEPTTGLTPLQGYETKPLVSLKEAVAPIDTPVHKLETLVWMAERNSQNSADGLTSAESASINLYTMEGPNDNDTFHSILNKKLRSKKRHELKPWYSYLKLFLTALYKLPSLKTTIWRGVRGDIRDSYQNDFIWWGVSSCTEAMEVAENFVGRSGVRTLFMIECINGKSIKSHSMYPDESEILLIPATYLRIIDKCRPADDLYIIRLREETPPHPLIASPLNSSQSSDTFSLEKITISDRDQSNRGAASEQSHESKSQDHYVSNQTTTDTVRLNKPWLDLQFHDKKQQSGKKLDELEKEMRDPPNQIDQNILNRIQGSMIGLALGDALGAYVEYRPHEYMVQNPVTDLEGGGTWGLKKGQFTDDTSMALCLANSLVVQGGFNPYDQLVRYKWWYKKGYMSATGQCFDIGAATSQSLNEFERRQVLFVNQHHFQPEEIDYLSDAKFQGFNVYCSEQGVADNGALMRLVPVPLFFHRHPEHAVEYSGVSGQITHGDTKVYDACRYYGALIVAALHDCPKDQLLDKQFYSKHKQWFGGQPLCTEVKEIAEGSFKKKGGYKDGIRGKDYIVNSLEAALWAFWSDDNSFEKGALAAVNLGDDTDTTAAIYGQLAGAYYGFKSLPAKWVKFVYAKEFMINLSKWIVYEGQMWQPSGAIQPYNPLSSSKLPAEPNSYMQPLQNDIVVHTHNSFERNQVQNPYGNQSMVSTGGSRTFHDDRSAKLSNPRGRPSENTTSVYPSNWNRHSKGKPPAIPERYQPGAIVVRPKLSKTQSYGPSSTMNPSQLRTRQDTKGYPPASGSTSDGSNFSYHMGTQNNNSYAHSPSAYYPASQHAPETTYDRRSSKPSDIDTYNAQSYATEPSSQKKNFK